MPMASHHQVPSQWFSLWTFSGIELIEDGLGKKEKQTGPVHKRKLSMHRASQQINRLALLH